MWQINKPKRNSSLSGSPTKSNRVDTAASVQDSELDSPSRESVQLSETIEGRDAEPIHLSESHESSVQLHLARQERAREASQQAQRKYVYYELRYLHENIF